MRLYVASSWRNATYPAVVEALRAAGHDCYDFRHPEPGNNGFAWREIDPAWQGWTPEQYRSALAHPVAVEGFDHDMRALRRADALVMVQPCGRSSSLELGFAAGAGLPTVVLLAQGEPELMLAMADVLCTSVDEVVAALAKLHPGDGRWRQGKCMGCREVMGPDGSCQCAGHYRDCDTMRRPYQGKPCNCWACVNRRAAPVASKGEG